MRSSLMRDFVGLLCFAVLSCTNPVARPETNKVLSREGGTLELGGGARVVVAAGALDGPVTVLGELVSAPAPMTDEAVSEVLALTPHGTHFNIPARVSLPFRPGTSRAPLRVMRLADAQDTTWEPVGGVRFEGNVAVFDTVSFSYYVVTEGGACELVTTPTACSSACECCGTSQCVNVATDAAHCGGCGMRCDAQSFCSSSSTCQPASPASLCANGQLYVVQGLIPDLTVVSPEQTTDGIYAAQIAAQLAATCPGLAVSSVSQAADGLLNPCTDEPLVGGGTTLLVTGGTFAQRLARYVEQSLAPLTMEVSADELQYTFHSRQGATLVSFARASLSDVHDYFVLSFTRDSAGAQIFQVYGVGWEGTPAAAWYVEHRLLPDYRAGTLSWSHYVLVEWSDDGDGVKSAGDTFTVLAQDVP